MFSYPLPRIKVTSPYGYRKDPFTGKRKFHGGIDLQARGDKVLAMMAGTVVKVGQDKTSGKYVPCGMVGTPSVIVISLKFLSSKGQ